METKQINIKNLKFMYDESNAWLINEDHKTVVFPTIDSFLNAVVENGQAKEEYTKIMKMHATKLKEVINMFGGIEKVITFLIGKNGVLTDEEFDKLRELECVVFNFIEYCMVSGIHTEDITKYAKEYIFDANMYESDEIDSNDRNYIFIDPEAKDKIWFMDRGESWGPDILLYKLSPNEQEELKKILKEVHIPFRDIELYVKALGLLLEEISQLFEE